MRHVIAAIAGVSWACSIALADPPPHPPTTDLPSPAGDDAQPQVPTPTQVTPPPQVITPPIVTISTMPVTKSIPGYWDDAPRTSAWVSTGITAGLLAVTLGWYFYQSHYTYRDKGNNPDCYGLPGGEQFNNCNAPVISVRDEIDRRRQVWFEAEFSLAALTVASSFIAVSRWARHYHFAREVRVWPTQGGAEVSLAHTF